MRLSFAYVNTFFSGLLLMTVALFFCTTPNLMSQSKGVRGDTVPAVPPLDEAALRERIQALRAPQPGGDYQLEFDLRHMPRRAPTVYYRGRLLGTWNEQGPVYRVILWPDEGQAHRDAVQLLITTGAQPQCWIVEPGGDIRQINAEAWFEPIMPGLIYTPADLAMTFLDWPMERYAGSTRVSSRITHLIDFTPPESAREAYPDIARLRLALDANFNAPVRVEWSGGRGDVLRAMNIVDFRKVDEQWIAGSVDMIDGVSRARDRFDVTDAHFGLRYDRKVFTPEALVDMPPVE
jgi:hypothetical protein